VKFALNVHPDRAGNERAVVVESISAAYSRLVGPRASRWPGRCDHPELSHSLFKAIQINLQ